MGRPAGSSPGSRAMARLEALRLFTDVPGQIDRLFLSPSHRRAAEAVAAMMREAGCDSVRIDALGTVVGRYEGRAAGLPAFLVGSHIDTVRDAGAYDGTLGVVAGIGVVEMLAGRGERLGCAIEVLAFGDEENVRFPSHLSSSRALAGTLTPDVLDLRDGDGVSVREALLAFGGDPGRIMGLARSPADILGYVEVHIEQGPVLEAEGLPLGVVTAINGASRRRVTVTGQAGHAGTVPMALRHDALVAAAEMVLAVERAGASRPDAVATVGTLALEPGAANVIPGRVSFVIDGRSPRDDDRIAMMADLEREIGRIASRRGVAVSIATISDTAACPCDPALSAGLADAVRRHQVPARHLPSGAGHDAMAMAALCPVAMLFVRCRGGISHHPDEFMTEADAEVALTVLADFLRALPAAAA